MIARVKNTGAFERPEVGDCLDDDAGAAIAPRVLPQCTGIACIDIAASPACYDGFACHIERAGERRKKFFTLANKMQYGTARRARPQPRQTRQQMNEPLDLGTRDALSHRGGASNQYHQNGSFMPGGSARPAVTSFILSS